jgi:proline dehydrogenase
MTVAKPGGNAVQQMVRAVAMPVLSHAASRYVAGTTLLEAGKLAARAATSGLHCTLCYWNDGTEDPAVVALEYTAIVQHISQNT